MALFYWKRKKESKEAICNGEGASPYSEGEGGYNLFGWCHVGVDNDKSIKT